VLLIDENSEIAHENGEKENLFPWVIIKELWGAIQN
jgi:hypothetical protein